MLLSKNMKVCPNCRTEYTDDALRFCLQDGTPLVNLQNKPPDFNTKSETMVSPKRVEPIRFDPPSSYQKSQSNWESSQPMIVERAPKKSNTAAIVALSVLGTMLVLGLGGAGAWLYSNNQKTVAVVNNNSSTSNRSTGANAANSQNSNANLASPTPTPTPTPSPTPTAKPTAKPTINPEQAKNITGDVINVVNDWKSASENLDMTGHLSYYADTVDYYRGGRVGIAKVRADKERAFSQYDSINLKVDNLRVIPDPAGDRATAIFDKEWRFEGADKYSAGKVQQQLTLVKSGGKWLISGERDLKVYYKE